MVFRDGGRSRGAPIYEKIRRGPYWIPPRTLGCYTFLYRRYGRNTFEVLVRVGGRGGGVWKRRRTCGILCRSDTGNAHKYRYCYLSFKNYNSQMCVRVLLLLFFLLPAHVPSIEASDDGDISVKTLGVVAPPPPPSTVSDPVLLAGVTAATHEILKLQKTIYIYKYTIYRLIYLSLKYLLFFL